jgi:5-methylcytosine-specific restriction endonuclease McrA
MRTSVVTGITYSHRVFSHEERADALRRSKSRCIYCKLALTIQSPEFTIEHIIQKYIGGTDDPSNLKAACRSCNAARGARTYREHLAYIKNKQNKSL